MPLVTVTPPPEIRRTFTWLNAGAPDQLLPTALLQPAAHVWLWLLPHAILFALNAQGYALVEGDMNPEQHRLAKLNGLTAVANVVIGALLYLLARRRGTSATLTRWSQAPAVVAVLAQVGYLWITTATCDALLPTTVTTWIYPTSRFLFNQYTFAMVPLFWGVLRLAGAPTGPSLAKTLGVSLLMTVGAPVALFFGFALLSTLGAHGRADAFGILGVTTLLVVTGVVMFIGLVRALLLTLRYAQRWHGTAERLAVIAVALVLPLAGLALNHAIPFPADFQSIEVYALALGNATILLFAAWQRTIRPRLCFTLLNAALPFTLYFFFVLLPFTPLAILAVVCFGLGFLILTPTLLFTLHAYLLAQTHQLAVRRGNSRLRLAVLGAAAGMVLPATFVVRGLADKADLNAALRYVMTPTVEAGAAHYPGDRDNLRRAVASHRAYKDGLYYPFLSDFYSWLVFDGLVLPDPTLDRIEQVFFPSPSTTKEPKTRRNTTGGVFERSSVRQRTRPPAARPVPHTARIDRATARAQRIEDTTRLTLALTITNDGPAPAEFVTNLPLPAGVVVQGFRLEVNGVLVPGRIFERKSAAWVYEMIRDSERRDPGLLRHIAPDELELRVFPVAVAHPSRVEIDFLVPAAVGAERWVGDTSDPAALLNQVGTSFGPQFAASSQGGYLVAGTAMPSLPPAHRSHYVHLIVDRSERNGFTGDVGPALHAIRQRFPESVGVRITAANYDIVDPLPELTTWRKVESATLTLEFGLPRVGGCAADLAVAHVLRQHRERDLDHAEAATLPPGPIIVLLSQNAGGAMLNSDLAAAWLRHNPDVGIYELNPAARWTSRQVATSTPVSWVRIGECVRPLTANLAADFPAATTGDVTGWSEGAERWLPIPGVTVHPGGDPWAQAAELQLAAGGYLLNPGNVASGLSTCVAASRRTGVLLPMTSYVVVENESQWRILAQAEQQKLGQNAALAFQEAPSPSAVIVGALFALYTVVRRMRSRRPMGHASCVVLTA